MSEPWPLVPLREVLTLQRRWVIPELDRPYTEIGVRSYGRGIFHKAPVTGADLGNKRVLRIEPGDLVLMNVFAWEGAVAVAGAAEAGMIGSHRYATYTANPARCIPDFLNLYFKTESGLELLRRVSPGSAGRNRTLNLAQFIQKSVPLPPIEEQRRIVARVEAIAAKVEEAQRLRRGSADGLADMLRSEFTRITAGVAKVRLGVVAPLERRPVQVEIDGTYPELGVRSFGKGTFHKPALPGANVGTKKLFSVRSGDLLFNIVFAWEGAIAVAKPQDEGRVGSHRFLTCVADPKFATAPFLSYYFLTPEGLAQVGAASPGGAGRNRTLGLKAAADMTVPTPPTAVQRRFDRLQDLAASLSLRCETAERELVALVPSVLDRAFRGEL